MQAERRVVDHDVTCVLDGGTFGAIEGAVAGEPRDGDHRAVIVIPPCPIPSVEAGGGVVGETEFMEMFGEVRDELGLPVV